MHWKRVPYLSALQMCSRRGAIQIHVYLLTYLLTYAFQWRRQDFALEFWLDDVCRIIYTMSTRKSYFRIFMKTYPLIWVQPFKLLGPTSPPWLLRQWCFFDTCSKLRSSPKFTHYSRYTSRHTVNLSWSWRKCFFFKRIITYDGHVLQLFLSDTVHPLLTH